MKFKINRNDEYLQELKKTVSANYNLKINDIK